MSDNRRRDRALSAGWVGGTSLAGVAGAAYGRNRYQRYSKLEAERKVNLGAKTGELGRSRAATERAGDDLIGSGRNYSSLRRSLDDTRAHIARVSETPEYKSHAALVNHMNDLEARRMAAIDDPRARKGYTGQIGSTKRRIEASRGTLAGIRYQTVEDARREAGEIERDRLPRATTDFNNKANLFNTGRKRMIGVEREVEALKKPSAAALRNKRLGIGLMAGGASLAALGALTARQAPKAYDRVRGDWKRTPKRAGAAPLRTFRPPYASTPAKVRINDWDKPRGRHIPVRGGEPRQSLQLTPKERVVVDRHHARVRSQPNYKFDPEQEAEYQALMRRMSPSLYQD